MIGGVLLRKQILLEWEVGHSETVDQPPEKWMEATVPGAVQLDYANAHTWEPYYWAGKYKDYGWMEDRFWTYRSLFPKPELSSDQRLFFVSKGIDYEYEIYLNGERLLYHEGMFTQIHIDLTGLLIEKNELFVRIHPAPKLQKEPADRRQADRSCKPPVSYGWDWHPRLIPLGIWDETFLEIRNATHLKSVIQSYTLSEDLTMADVEIAVEGVEMGAHFYKWKIADPYGNIKHEQSGAIASEDFGLNCNLLNIALWWPHDHGEQYLYTSTIQILDADRVVKDEMGQRIGFRHVRLVMNEGAWDEPTVFPKGRSVPPMQLEINGRRIFCKGSNWIPPEIFPGTLTRARYQELLDLAKDANMNILRVWGGGYVNKDSFFDLCDEKGILVWQEFPLACLPYEGTPEYLAVLEQESSAIIRRIKGHPSLALWCGGNELYNFWSGMTDQSKALRLLNSECYRLDADTPFIPTAPIMGMGHGHYMFRDETTGEDVFQMFAKAHCTAYTEFGVAGPSPISVLKKSIPEEDLWPPERGTAWEDHFAWDAWLGDTWLQRDMIEAYCGPSENLETLIANGQMMQAEGYKCVFEEARRQKPYCAMAINWSFADVWPMAGNCALIAWPNEPKPALNAVKQACRPVLASARIPKFVWQEGEEFTCDLYILNDTVAGVTAGEMIVSLEGDSDVEILRWSYPEVEPNRNLAGPTARICLPGWKSQRFKLRLEIKDHPEMSSTYILLLHDESSREVRDGLSLNE